MNRPALLALENIRYRVEETAILDSSSLSIAAGEKILILGPSGSGKTTLLHIMAGILPPGEGRVLFEGHSLSDLTVEQRDRQRAERTGMVLQKLHVISYLSAFDNLALVYSGLHKPVDKKKIFQRLADVGLAGKEYQKAGTLSQGETQRLAIARAIIHDPAIVFADEPTAALDDANTEKIMALLLSQVAKSGAALIVATHDARIKHSLERTITIENGKVTA
jgi:putative ABC transport system ATP-binding protein